MVRKTEVWNKNSELSEILSNQLGKRMNKARIKFMSLMISALCKVQTVTFTKLAAAFGNKADPASSLRRIQRFMAGYVLDKDIIARFIRNILPFKGPYILALDRTNWKYGRSDINIFTLGITYKGIAFPVLFTMLNKQGNSNTKERIALIERFLTLFGVNSIDHLVADREFVGKEWLNYLNFRRIRYHIRIRENFRVKRHDVWAKASWLFGDLHVRESKHLNGIYYVNGQACYLSGSRLKNTEGKPELQILVSYCKPEEALDLYKKRWQIETMFKGMKSSGFNMMATHLKDPQRISRMLSLVMIAFVWCYLVGIFINDHIKPIKILKHKRRAVSLFKYGLNYISSCLLNPFRIPLFDIFKFLSYT